MSNPLNKPGDAARLREITSQHAAMRPEDLEANHFKRLEWFAAAIIALIFVFIFSMWTAMSKKNNLVVGIADLEHGRPKQAIVELTKAIAGGNAPLIAYHYRALAYGLDGNHAAALADFGEVIARDPRRADAFMGRACEYMQALDFLHGSQDLTTALKQDPQLLDAYRLRAVAELKLKLYASAVRDCQEYLRRCGRNAAPDMRIRTLMVLASTYKASGDLKSALQTYSEALATQKPTADLFDRRAEVLQKLSQTQRAIADYTAAIKLTPTAERFFQRALCYASNGKLSSAVADLDQSIHLRSSYLAARMERARLSVKVHNYKQALADARIVVDAQPDNKDAADLYAQASKLAGGRAPRDIAKLSEESVESAASVASAVADIPATGDAATMVFQGYKLLAAGNAAAAVGRLQAAVKLDPQNAAARRYLANALAANGNPLAAVQQYESLSQMQATTPDDLLSWAKALDRAGDTRGAIARYQDYVAIRRGDIQARLALVEVYQRSGQRQKALDEARAGMQACRNPADVGQFQRLILKLDALKE